MFDFSWAEIAILVAVALIFIGPKDLPHALRALAKAMAALRRLAAEFQGHLDELVRAADLKDSMTGAPPKPSSPTAAPWAPPAAGAAQQPSQPSGDLPLPAMPQPPAEAALEGGGHSPAPFAETPLRTLQQPAPAAPMAAEDYARATPIKPPAERGTPTPPVPLPTILPPRTAQRLAGEIAQSHRPPMLPPQVTYHNGKRVLVGLEDAAHPETTGATPS
ncbi:twin-arginine translocase subunit TatB [Formicincola oecophyllae]|uniref:Twin-arginine translocase subunit TatB n=1 Tax=Formicincola oecophyllae TaxID=2558361 RepID=A0A4Y6U903_9PROT|nr:Sec-independent protein translocase protein TatB [Formicincola oecophyllae]QDH13852.1 twin-arginine translocase subunit TatB [Formicincola oecophyllae]